MGGTNMKEEELPETAKKTEKNSKVLEDKAAAQAKQDRINLVLKKLDAIERHCEHVRESGALLARRMLQKGYNERLCVALLRNCRTHDASKFSGIEFDHLLYSDNKEAMKLAVETHRQTNSHHASFWSSINEMPDLFLFEMGVDLLSRSQEMGEDIFEYIKTDFLKKHNLTTSSRVYKKLKEALDILLDKKFEKLE